MNDGNVSGLASGLAKAIKDLRRDVETLNRQMITMQPLMRLNRATCTGQITPTTEQDVPGCTLTININRPRTILLVIGIFDVEINSGSNTIFNGHLSLDGVNRAPDAVLENNDGVADVRATISQVWCPEIAAVGSHTIKLTAQRVTGTATCTVRATNTGLILGNAQVNHQPS